MFVYCLNRGNSNASEQQACLEVVLIVTNQRQHLHLGDNAKSQYYSVHSRRHLHSTPHLTNSYFTRRGNQLLLIFNRGLCSISSNRYVTLSWLFSWLAFTFYISNALPICSAFHHSHRNSSFKLPKLYLLHMPKAVDQYTTETCTRTERFFTLEAFPLRQHTSLVYSNIHWPKDIFLLLCMHKVQESHLLQHTHTHLKYKHYSYYGILKACKKATRVLKTWRIKNCTHLPGERNCSLNSYTQKLKFW